MTRIPVPATEPDPIKSADWEPTRYGETVAGIVSGRETHTSKKFGNQFEVLVVRAEDGDETRVSCARKHLAQLVAEHDPRPGDGIAVTYFGEAPDGFGYQYAMRVQKYEAVDGVPF